MTVCCVLRYCTNNAQEFGIEDKVTFNRFGKSMLAVWGLWPVRGLSQRWKRVYNVYGVFIMCITLVPYNIFSALDAVAQIQLGRWMEIMPSLSVTLAMFLGCVKVAVCLFNTSTIEGFMKMFQDSVNIYKPTAFFRPIEIIKKCVWLYNIQTAVCFGLIGILIMTDVDAYLKEPIILHNNKSIPALPFVNWLPYDYSESPYYELSFCLLNFWFFVSADVIFVHDTICMGQMIHTGGQLKILNEALKTIRQRASLEAKLTSLKNLHMFNSGNPSEKNINKIAGVMFRKCAVHHQSILQYTRNFQELYSTIIFLQFFISCLMICFTILIVTNNDSPVSSRVTCLIILLCSMWELSVYCYFGNEIINESNELSQAIYMSEWCTMDAPIKADMLIMMTKTHKPIIINAGRFVPLSLETFLIILKASYSYYAFLSNVSNN